MFNLGDVSLEDIPDGFPLGASNHRMSITKVEILVPSNLKDEPEDLSQYRRNLKLTFEVSDPESEYYELTANTNVVIYNFPDDTNVYETLSTASKARVRKFLSFYRQRMRKLGFSDEEINNNEVTEDEILARGNDLLVTIKKATDDAWPQIVDYKPNVSAIED